MEPCVGKYVAPNMERTAAYKVETVTEHEVYILTEEEKLVRIPISEFKNNSWGSTNI